MDERHVGAACVDELLRIDVDLMTAASVAPDPDGEAVPLRRPWRREVGHVEPALRVWEAQLSQRALRGGSGRRGGGSDRRPVVGFSGVPI